LRLPLSKIPAVHHRHPEIEQNQIGRCRAAQVLQCLLSIRDSRNGITFVFEGEGQRLTGSGIILDHEDTFPGAYAAADAAATLGDYGRAATTEPQVAVRGAGLTHPGGDSHVGRDP
jgi:hypothetical protein